jgi:hypothetical protein
MPPPSAPAPAPAPGSRVAGETVATQKEDAAAKPEPDVSEAAFAFAPSAPAATLQGPQEPPATTAPRPRRFRLPGRERSGGALPAQFEAAPAEPSLPGSRRWTPPSRLQTPRAAALTLILGAAAIGSAWWILSGASQGPKRLAVSFPADGSSVYRMGASLDWRKDSRGLDSEVHTEFEGILTLRTVAKDPGGARVRAILDLSTLVVNDRPVFRPPTMRGRIHAAGDGTVRQGDYLELPRPSAPIMLPATGLTPVLPDSPVEPGDSWTDSVSVRMGRDRLRGTARSRFLRYEDVEGVETAVLQGTRDFKIDGGPPLPGKGTLTVDQTAWVNPDTGAVLRMTATVRFSFRARSVVLDGWDRYELKAV